MADRNVREPAQALAQRLGRLEDRQRAMALRTWPGAIRTAMEEEVEVSDPLEVTMLVSVAVTAGRWVVIGQSQFDINPVTSHVDARLMLAAFDSTSGDELTGADYNLPDSRDYLYPLTGIRVSPMVATGHFVTNDVITMRMSAMNDAGDVFVARNSCLLLIPV